MSHDSIKRHEFAATGLSPVFGPVEGVQVASQATRLGATGTSTVLVQGTNTPDLVDSWATVATLNPATTGAAGTAQNVAIAPYMFWRFSCTVLQPGQTLTASISKQ